MAMALAKVLPFIPGHFTRYEWLALAIWTAIGAAVSVPWQLQKNPTQDKAAVSVGK
jgi:hypothetical protein